MFRFRILLVLLPLALVPLHALAEDPKPPAEPEWSSEKSETLLALAREYLTKSSRRERDEVLGKAGKLGAIPDRPMKGLVKDLFRIARSGPKSEGKGLSTAKYPKFPGKYYLSGAGGGKKGIFIGLHGGESGIGDGRTAQSQWGSATGKGLIGVFPTAHLPGKPFTWFSPDVERCVLEIVAELKRTYRIDTNRIYVAGHSLGGSGAFHIGPRHADIFAAISPNAGGCHGSETRPGFWELPGGYMGNLFNTPIFITHYAGDPRVVVHESRAAARELAGLRKEHPDGYEYRYVEGEGVSHGFPPGTSPSKIIAWMTKHRRDPYPKKVIWEPAAPEKRRFFWLRKQTVFTSRGRGQRIVATIGKNEIDIKANNRNGLSVLLAPSMFKADRPVVVRFNGTEVFRGFVQRDPAALIESVIGSIDPEQVFEYRIDL
jgi:hypothetical protein